MRVRELQGLQLFAEAVQGKKIVYLFRIKSKAARNDCIYNGKRKNQE